MPVKDDQKSLGRKSFPTRFWIWLLEFADDFFQVLVALILLVAAVLVFLHLLSLLFQSFAQGRTLLSLVYAVIHDALLILILLELIWTAITYLESRTLPLEPFIVVAIIASVRRLLFLGVQTVEGEVAPPILWDIGVHAGIVFIFALSLFLVRWSRRFLRPPTNVRG